MRITQREINALLRLFGNGSLKTKLAALVVVISAVLGLFYTGTAGGQGVIEGRVMRIGCFLHKQTAAKSSRLRQRRKRPSRA
jgi:hypothetical protein